MNQTAPQSSSLFAPGTDAPPELLGRYHIHEYVRFLGAPLLGLVALNGLSLALRQPLWSSWLILALLFSVVLWRVRQSDFTDREATSALAIAGLIAGLIHALLVVIVTPAFHLYFNLIAEPMLAAGAGGAVSWATLQVRGRRSAGLFDTAWRTLRKGVH